MPTLIGSNFVVHLCFPAQAGIRAPQNLKGSPTQSNLFQSRLVLTRKTLKCYSEQMAGHPNTVMPLVSANARKTGFPETDIAPKQLGDSLIPSKPFLSLRSCPRLPLEFAHVLEQPMP